MALKDVKPTRSELINLKKKIKLSQNGYKILKMKRDGLIMEFFKVLEEAKDSRGALLEKYARAQEMMAIANTNRFNWCEGSCIFCPGKPGYHPDK